MTGQRRITAGSALLVLAALLASGASGAGAATAAKLPTVACTLPGIAGPVRCAVLEVPENPERPDARRLPIHVAVIPAASGKALSDPIVVLMGGPGESAISAAAIYAAQLAPLLADRDLLLVDQRGAGQSAALQCDLFSSTALADDLRDFFPPAAVERCRRRLQTVADLTRYTYPYFAQDLEEVRRALGFGPLNLFAGSYGTRAAQAYMRAYPQSVRTAYLGSVVPVDLEGVLDFAKTEQTALQHTIENCARDAACHAAFPQLPNEFSQIRERLASGKVKVTLAGHPAPVLLDPGRVAEWFRSKLYRPHDAAALPWTIHRAFTGDWSPVVDGIVSGARDLGSDISLGLFFSITCSEDMPYVREQDVAPQTRGTFLGDYRLRQQQAACQQWPRSTLPEGYRKPLRSNVPTLFVTGDLDGGTPLSFTERVARGFSNHATVVTHGQGHTEWNDCIAEKYQQLVRSASVRGLDSRCPAIALPPFKT